jgi:hypothetical protein
LFTQPRYDASFFTARYYIIPEQFGTDLVKGYLHASYCYDHEEETIMFSVEEKEGLIFLQEENTWMTDALSVRAGHMTDTLSAVRECMTYAISAGREYMSDAFPGKKIFFPYGWKTFWKQFQGLHDRSSVFKGEYTHSNIMSATDGWMTDVFSAIGKYVTDAVTNKWHALCLQVEGKYMTDTLYKW